MNVTVEGLRDYLSMFHETVATTADQFLPAEHRGSLLHLSPLPARIVGYVSTQFGVAFEYVKSNNTKIDVLKGSARVEDLFVQAPGPLRHIGPLFKIQEGPSEFHQPGGIFRLTVADAFPFRLAGPNACYSVGDVEFRIGKWRRVVDYAEIFGNRQADFWSLEKAVARAKDEVLAALVQINRAENYRLSIGAYIGRFKERAVLLLGDYDDAGMQRLEKIREVLSAGGYEPILIKDIPDQPVQDLSQKVATIGSLARFVIVDDSSKSGHLMEIQLCKQNNWITVLLRQNSKGGSWMTAGASVLSNVIFEHSYDDESYHESVRTVIEWAEAKFAELQRKFDGLYPWRIQP